MAAPIRPNGVSAFGKEKWVYVPAIANPAAPTVAEVTAGTTLDITGFLYAEGFDGVGADTTRNTAPRRLLDTRQNQTLGSVTYTMGDLLYAYDPQAAPGSNGKKALEKLLEGATGYFVNRLGIDADTDLAAGQRVNVVSIELGPQVPVKTSTGEEGETAIRQAVGATGTFEINVAIAA